MATIHRRRLVSGEIVWELTHGTGAGRQRFTAGKTREEAQEVLDQFNRQLALHGEGPQDGSVALVIGEYAQFLKTNRRPRTVARYLRVIKTFHECFLIQVFPDVQRLRQLRPMHLEEYKRRRGEGEITEVKSSEETAREQALRLEVGQGTKVGSTKERRARFGWLGRHGIQTKVSPRTINYELRVLITFFLWAIKRNHLFINPGAMVERFRLPKRVLPKFMTTEQLKKFFGACDEEERRLFMSILLSGMRKGEAEHLTWSDISFELGVIFIQEKPEFEWKPKTDERLIPISPMLRELLTIQHAKRTSDLLVFANRAGNRDTHMLTRLKNVCKRAGIRSSTVHALRHSFGAHLRMAGVSLADIGDLLGHKDLATTQIYAKVQQEHLRTMVSKLNPLVGEVDGAKPPTQRLPAPKAITTTSDDGKQ
jgi:integrase/recombinase XerC/integrase/recombinase XerD